VSLGTSATGLTFVSYYQVLSSQWRAADETKNGIPMNGIETSLTGRPEAAWPQEKRLGASLSERLSIALPGQPAECPSPEKLQDPKSKVQAPGFRNEWWWLEDRQMKQTFGLRRGGRRVNAAFRSFGHSGDVASLSGVE
jgi:hypothetical protein